MTSTALPSGLEPEYTAAEVAKAFKRSERWLKDRMKRDNVAHTRHGNKITFTPAQFKAFQDMDAVVPEAASVTTGPAKGKR